MKAYLRGFENALRQLLEGRLGRLLGARTQPVDLARRLAEHMEDHRTVGAGRSYAPNNFRVFLAPATLAGFASFETGLEEELAAYLDRRAREADLHFVGRLRVTLLADPEIRPDRMRIESDLVDRRGVVLAQGGQHTRAIPVPEEASRPRPPALELLVGRRRVALEGRGSLSIGRALDNDLILDAASVSRHHARLSARGEHWSVEDLGSTHGTFVNGERVRDGVLRPGDRLQLGEALLRLGEPGQAPAEPGAEAEPS